jgi:hypothetical protein
MEFHQNLHSLVMVALESGFSPDLAAQLHNQSDFLGTLVLLPKILPEFM